MKRWISLALALVPGLGVSPAQDAPSAGELAEAPFYRKYLVSGNALDDEIIAMEKKLEAEPGDANLHNDFGNLLALRGFPEQAAEQYTEAAKLEKSNFISLYNLGLLRETEGKNSDAISAYKKSIARKPGFPPSRFRLGRLYELSGKAEDAVAQYAKAFWIDPSMRDPRRNPLVIDSELMYRASLANYERDVARATLDRDVTFEQEPAFRQVPVDRSVDSAEVVESEPAAPREVGPGSGAPAGPSTVRKPRTPPSPDPSTPRMRAPGSRPPRATPRSGAPVAVTPAPPPVPAEEPTEMQPPENVEPPQEEPTAIPEEEVEPS
jgi:Flp pilus assembly protein TadD